MVRNRLLKGQLMILLNISGSIPCILYMMSLEHLNEIIFYTYSLYAVNVHKYRSFSLIFPLYSLVNWTFSKT